MMLVELYDTSSKNAYAAPPRPCNWDRAMEVTSVPVLPFRSTLVPETVLGCSYISAFIVRSLVCCIISLLFMKPIQHPLAGLRFLRTQFTIFSVRPPFTISILADLTDCPSEFYLTWIKCFSISLLVPSFSLALWTSIPNIIAQKHELNPPITIYQTSSQPPVPS